MLDITQWVESYPTGLQLTNWPVHKLEMWKSVLIAFAPSKSQKVNKNHTFNMCPEYHFYTCLIKILSCMKLRLQKGPVFICKMHKCNLAQLLIVRQPGILQFFDVLKIGKCYTCKLFTSQAATKNQVFFTNFHMWCRMYVIRWHLGELRRS